MTVTGHHACELPKKAQRQAARHERHRKGRTGVRAAQAVDNDAISVWQMSLYGGFTMAGGDGNDFMLKL